MHHDRPISAAATFVVAVLAIVGCGGERPDAGRAASSGAPAVEALPARSGSLPLEEALSGVVRARNQVAIRPEISAAVVEVLVRNGDRGHGRSGRWSGSTTRRSPSVSAAPRPSCASPRRRRSKRCARVDEVHARVVRIRALAAEGLDRVSSIWRPSRRRSTGRVPARVRPRPGWSRPGRVPRRADRRSPRRRCGRPSRVVVGRRDVEVGMVVGSSDVLFVLGDSR